MGLVNPSFTDAGGGPGQAAGWTLVSRCQAERWAAFGPSPAAAVEDFDRWARARLAFAAGDLVLGFFAPRGSGHEDFEQGWDNDLFLMELSPARLDAASFGAAEVESFEWVVSLGAWSDVAAAAASFGGLLSPAEKFAAGWAGSAFLQAWSAVPASTALFGASTAETFAGGWLDTTTL